MRKILVNACAEPLTSDLVSQYLAYIGQRGGKAGKGKSKARTKEQARAAALARWAKVKSKTK